jgi:hypothetical protein
MPSNTNIQEPTLKALLKQIEKKLGIGFYFAQPHHAWERGTNENTNGLIRQYLPKGMSLEKVTQKQCNRIAEILNNRPRKRHGYKTPKEIYEKGHRRCTSELNSSLFFIYRPSQSCRGYIHSKASGDYLGASHHPSTMLQRDLFPISSPENLQEHART